jgi:hypothetical protein
MRLPKSLAALGAESFHRVFEQEFLDQFDEHVLERRGGGDLVSDIDVEVQDFDDEDEEEVLIKVMLSYQIDVLLPDDDKDTCDLQDEVILIVRKRDAEATIPAYDEFGEDSDGSDEFEDDNDEDDAGHH